MKRMGMPPLLDKWGSSSLKVGRIVMPGGQAALTTAHDRPHQQQQYHNRPHQQQHYQQQQQGAHNRPHQQQPNQQQQGARVKQSRPLSGKLQEDRVEQQYLQQEHQYQQQREGVRLHSLPVSEALKDSSKEKVRLAAVFVFVRVCVMWIGEEAVCEV
jgi:flagellar biosynthesis GTPase FlhF